MKMERGNTSHKTNLTELKHRTSKMDLSSDITLAGFKG